MQRLTSSMNSRLGIALTQCAGCRLRAIIAIRQLQRGIERPHNFRRLSTITRQSRPFTAYARRRDDHAEVPNDIRSGQPTSPDEQNRAVELDPSTAARHAREIFGDVLPDGYLDPAELKAYERLYGPPLPAPPLEEDDLAPKHGVVRLLEEGEHGELVDVPYDHEIIGMNESQHGTIATTKTEERKLRKMSKSKRGKFFVRATKAELDATVLDPNLTKLQELEVGDVDPEWNALHDAGRAMYLDDVRYLKLEKSLRLREQTSDADELVQFMYMRYQSDRQAALASSEHVEPEQHESEDELDDQDDLDEGAVPRTHPLTEANRFGTFPSTIQIPRSTFTDPIIEMLSDTPPRQLAQTARRILGGDHLPWSPVMSRLGPHTQQRALPISVFKTDVPASVANVFLTAAYPAIYASVTSVLVETRKRLGREWLQGLLNKPGGPLILDAGGAGAAVLAARDVLRAEWQHMHDTSHDPDASRDVALAEGQIGGPPTDVPTGKATVVIASDHLRHRASKLLDNTAFVPRLPDYVHASDQEAKERGKYDIVIAPHTLWALEQDFHRRQHVSKLWSLLSSSGGILILIEKGIPRAFDTIAGVRQFLLDKRIAARDSGGQLVADPTPDLQESEPSSQQREPGMIVAPCTNHVGCPMHVKHGDKGKRGCCAVSQRYIRPAFLQKLLGARDKNFEDARFSYLSVMRGRDLRGEIPELVQGSTATDRAFRGYEDKESTGGDPAEARDDIVEFDPTRPAVADFSSPLTDTETAHSLNLPRAILTPLKRTGHVIMDLCTPSGRLERWTVPRSFSKQAYRDARKSGLGDLWALGAKTRVSKDNRVLSAKEAERVERQRRIKRQKPNVVKVPVDGSGRVRTDEMRVDGAAVRSSAKRRVNVKGIRDKRDKKGLKHGM